MIREGTVVYKLINVGSKSERLTPFLYEGNGQFLKIWMHGDSSLFSDYLKKYDGKHITLLGEINEYDVFLIETIEEVVITDLESNNKNNNTSMEEQN